MVRKMKSMNGLELLLSFKNYSIKDFYTETVLMMCHSFLIEYLSEEKKLDYRNDLISEEDTVYIREQMEIIFEHLEKSIITYPAILRIMNNSTKSRQGLLKARTIEPYGYYYNTLIDAFFARLKYVTKLDEEETWSPDLLVMNLILDLKERPGYTFNKFEFIRDFDFTRMIEIYAEVNRKLKLKNKIKMGDHIQKQTIVRKMNHVSLYMIDKMINKKYVQRQSNNSKRKKRK